MATKDKQLELEKNPTGGGEADEQFSTSDEKADQRAKNHEVKLLELQMGPLGKLIGSTDSSRTIAFLAIFLCFLLCAVIFCLAFDKTKGEIGDSAFQLLSLILSIVTGCIGFIFGSKPK